MSAAYWAYLPGILLLLVVSGFFSGSEAAFFSLSATQRRSLAKGSRASRVAFSLIERPERLLMGILFWNLAINITFFSLVSKLSMAVSDNGQSSGIAATISILSLVSIIVFGEFFPKSMAVVYQMTVVNAVALPLAVAIRVLDGFLPMIRFVNEASRRLLWPGLKPEPYLELADLERAFELSAVEDAIFDQESQVLRNLVLLSDIRVEEWMRPRTEFRVFKPPVSLEMLGGQRTPSGFMLITTEDGSDLVSAIDLNAIGLKSLQNIEALQTSLVIIPWCATMVDALSQLRKSERRVAAIVNEFGETVGILTIEDIYDAILQVQSGRMHLRQFAKSEIKKLSDGVWQVTGMTKLRRLERVLGTRINDNGNLTVGGVVQEQLHRIPEVGDSCQVDDWNFKVVEAGLRGEILVQVTSLAAEEQE